MFECHFHYVFAPLWVVRLPQRLKSMFLGDHFVQKNNSNTLILTFEVWGIGNHSMTSQNAFVRILEDSVQPWDDIASSDRSSSRNRIFGYPKPKISRKMGFQTSSTRKIWQNKWWKALFNLPYVHFSMALQKPQTRVSGNRSVTNCCYIHGQLPRFSS